jgi:hypothetical protein
MIENGWPEPDWSILEDHRGELPGFPLGCLPTPTSAWVTRAARGAGVTPAHVAVPVLGVVGGLVGCARKVQASASWSEPLAMWTGVVGYSGSGKTPGIEVVKRTLTAIENHWQTNIAELARQHQERAALAKAQQRQWRKQVQQALAKALVPPPMPLAAQLPGPFTPPRLFITNATIEQIVPLLAARPRGLICMIDELSGLFLNMRRYGGCDEPFWLSSWSGGREVVERRSGSQAVDHLLVGLVGGFQPDALARCFRGDRLGMYARLLFTWPEEPGYAPLTDEIEELDPDFVHALSRLVDLSAEESGRLLQSKIPLTRIARMAFEGFRQKNDVARKRHEGREREYLSKAPAHVLRLAGSLQFLNWAVRGGAEPDQVDEEYMRRAIQLWDGYFLPHAYACLRLIGITDKHADARTVLNWLRNSRRATISREEVRTDALRRRLDDQETGSLLGDLERLGWLRRVTPGLREIGRPRVRWAVNPQLWSAPEMPEMPKSGAMTP